MKIKKYKLEKVFKEEVDFRMPTEEIYLFEFHVRRSIRVTPVWTTWNKEHFSKDEELYELIFTVVYDGFNHNSTIIQYVIRVSTMEDIYSKSDYNNESFKLLDFLNTYDTENIRTKEQFESDFQTVLNKLQNPKI